MNQNLLDEQLQAIGSNMIRVMALQACARITGTVTQKEINQAADGMTRATRIAGSLLRTLAGQSASGDNEAKQQASRLLQGCPECVTGVINTINDGYLALSFIEPTEI